MVVQSWSSHLLVICPIIQQNVLQNKKNPNISNFIPTPNVYNKYKPNLELESSYSLFKQITRFKVIKNRKLTTLFIYLIFIYQISPRKYTITLPKKIAIQQDAN